MSAIVNIKRQSPLAVSRCRGLQSNESIASSVIGTLEEGASLAAQSFAWPVLGFSVEAGLLISRPDLNKTFYGTAVWHRRSLLGNILSEPQLLCMEQSRVTAIAGESISSFSTSLHFSNSSSNNSIDDGSLVLQPRHLCRIPLSVRKILS